MSCLHYAQQYLSKYPKSVEECRQQLTKKGFSNEEIESSIPLLLQQGFLNDRNYAAAWLHSEVVRKGKPLLLIKQKLLRKGIEKELLTELIAEVEAEVEEGQGNKIHKEIIRLRAKEKSDPEIIQNLLRKGFSYGQIKEEMKKEVLWTKMCG